MKQKNQRTALTSLCALALALGCGAAAGQAQEANPKPPVLERDGSFTYRDTRLPLQQPVPARRWLMYVPRSDALQYGPMEDPKNHAKYAYRLQVQVVSDDPTLRRGEDVEGGKDASNAVRRFVVHYNKEEDQVLARRVGSVMARLYWIGRDYLDRGPLGQSYMNVWLNHDGMAGGEEYQGNIYLHKIDQARAPAEWVRELAHEYGHATLPKMGPYTEPETYANGYLGERLYMKWMLVDNDLTDLWDQPIDGAAYMANQITPLRERFMNEGPTSPAADLTNTEGMNYFIGEMMALEAAHGPAFFKQLIKKFATPRPQNLGLYFTAAIQDMNPVLIPIDGKAYIPKKSQLAATATATAPGAYPRFQRAAYWIYLPGGEWRISLEGQAPPTLQATLEAAPLKPGPAFTPGSMSWETSISTANAMWRRLELVAPGGSTLEVRRLALTKKDQPFRPGGFGNPRQPNQLPPGFGQFGK